jgi:hypothetical protein
MAVSFSLQTRAPVGDGVAGVQGHARKLQAERTVATLRAPAERNPAHAHREAIVIVIVIVIIVSNDGGDGSLLGYIFACCFAATCCFACCFAAGGGELQHPGVYAPARVGLSVGDGAHRFNGVAVPVCETGIGSLSRIKSNTQHN